MICRRAAARTGGCSVDGARAQANGVYGFYFVGAQTAVHLALHALGVETESATINLGMVAVDALDEASVVKDILEVLVSSDADVSLKYAGGWWLQRVGSVRREPDSHPRRCVPQIGTTLAERWLTSPRSIIVKTSCVRWPRSSPSTRSITWATRHSTTPASTGTPRAWQC